MRQQLDFLEQLKEIIQDYDIFCRNAEKLKWNDIEEQHARFQTNALGIDFEVYEFPKDYMILTHAAEVYTRCVLSSMAYFEEWDQKFWDIPLDERKVCLTKGRELYESYAFIRDLRLVERDWDYLAKEIKYFADYNKIPELEQKKYLERFQNTLVIELGGYYAGDACYWVIKENALLVISCGCWD